MTDFPNISVDGLGEANENPGRWRVWGGSVDNKWALTDHPHQGEKGNVLNVTCPFDNGRLMRLQDIAVEDAEEYARQWDDMQDHQADWYDELVRHAEDAGLGTQGIVRYVWGTDKHPRLWWADNPWVWVQQ